MAEAKIEIKVGAVSFSGEGEGKWLSEQLDKILEKIPELAKVTPLAPSVGNGAAGAAGSGQQGSGGLSVSGTLAGFLKAKNATTNQTRKFLATALWLTDTQNKEHMTTSDVSKALTDAKQTPLSNASQNLASNISQGFCHKTGKQFYVTDDGRGEVG